MAVVGDRGLERVDKLRLLGFAAGEFGLKHFP
jgi:hypothetical protein